MMRARSVSCAGALIVLCFSFALSGVTAAESENDGPASSGAEISQCHIPGVESWVECGTLAVPLDHNMRDGETIEVGFARLPALTAAPASTPLFVLAGGPGQAALSLVGGVNQFFTEFRRQHDIVFIDQRGVGRSAALDCELPEENLYAPAHEFFDAELLADCLAQLPGDLSHFSTFNAVRDFDAVRSALGYDRVHLYGGSYGSRAAIAYVALLPENVDRVVLDGAAPPALPIGLFGASAAAAFEGMIERCEAVRDCRDRFPDIAGDLDRALSVFDSGPVSLSKANPTTGEPTEILLRRATAFNLLRVLLYAPSTTVMLPLIIERMAVEDYRPLFGLIALLGNMEVVNTLLNLNIVCNEDFPFWSKDALASDAQNSFDRDASHLLFGKVCPEWPAWDMEDRSRYEFSSDHPTLILSGRGDPVTPPSNGDQTQLLFTHSRHIVAEQAGHIVAFTECGADIVTQFLDGAAPEIVDATCLGEATYPAFVLDGMGLLAVPEEPGADSDETQPTSKKGADQ